MIWNKEVKNLKSELDSAKLSRAAVLDASENIEQQLKDKNIEHEKLLSTYRNQIDELTSKLAQVEKDNDSLLEKVIKYSKDKTLKILQDSPVKNEFQVKSRASEEEEFKKEAMEIFNIGTAKKNELIGQTNIRMMTLKQLKDIINEIYHSKEKHDEKWKKTKLPLETMEQFMFTYLNQKYGLKNLIIEWAASIVNGVKWHMKDDSDIALFAKLLKNEVEEDFRYIQQKFKTTVSTVLKKHLKEKYKLKSESEIVSMQEQLEDGFITTQMTDYILDFIYERGDKEKINSMIQERKKLQVLPKNLYSNRGRNITPPRYSINF